MARVLPLPQPGYRPLRAHRPAAGVSARPDVVLADAGYWHQAQMDRLVDRAIGVLIPPDAGKRQGARPGWDGGLYAFMRRLLATDFGGELYAKRQGMIEPVFANTKFNRRIDRFLRRGRAACRSEWRFTMATHNLLKLHRRRAAAQRRTATSGGERTGPAPLRDSHRGKRERRRAMPRPNGRGAQERIAGHSRTVS